jgi:tryptophanyl-tRNA synthetase
MTKKELTREIAISKKLQKELLFLQSSCIGFDQVGWKMNDYYYFDQINAIVSCFDKKTAQNARNQMYVVNQKWKEAARRAKEAARRAEKPVSVFTRVWMFLRNRLGLYGLNIS